MRWVDEVMWGEHAHELVHMYVCGRGREDMCGL